jgi:hypothetical protein
MYAWRNFRMASVSVNSWGQRHFVDMVFGACLSDVNTEDFYAWLVARLRIPHLVTSAHVNVVRMSWCKVLAISSCFNENCNVSTHFGKTDIIFVENPTAVLDLLCTGIHGEASRLIKLKLSHYTPRRSLGGRYSSYLFSTSALDGGEWSASRPGRALAPKKGPRYPLYRRLGGPQS